MTEPSGRVDGRRTPGAEARACGEVLAKAKASAYLEAKANADSIREWQEEDGNSKDNSSLPSRLTNGMTNKVGRRTTGMMRDEPGSLSGSSRFGSVHLGPYKSVQ